MDSSGGGLVFVIVLVIGVGIAVAVGYYIAEEKRRDPMEGVALGCLLGPIGWVIEALLPEGGRSRPVSTVDTSDPTWRAAALGSLPPPLPMPRPARGAVTADPAGGGRPRPIATLYAFGESDAEGTVATSLAIGQARRIAEVERQQGRVVVEAVWQDAGYSRLGLAFGRPGVAYARVWPSGDDVKDQVFAPPGTADGGPSPAQPGPTKICPECAETIMAAARICRYCRHAFTEQGELGPG